VDSYKQRLMAALVAALIVLISLNLWWEAAPPEDVDSPPWSRVWEGLTVDQLEEVRLTGAGPALVLHRAVDGWRVTAEPLGAVGGDPSDRAADPRRTDQFLSALVNLQRGPSLRRDALEQYGLQPPARVIDMSGPDGPIGTFSVGRDAPAGSGTYFLLEDDVYMSRARLGGHAGEDAEWFRTRQIVAFARSSVTAVKIQGLKGAFTLEKDSQGWWIAASSGRHRASEVAIDTFLETLLDLRVEAFGAAGGQPEDQALFRIDHAGGTDVIEVWRQEASWWAQGGLQGSPVETTKGLASLRAGVLDSWLSTHALPVRTSTLTSIDLRMDGGTFHAEIGEEGWEHPGVQPLLMALMQTEVNRTVATPPAGAESGRIQLTETQGRIETLTLHQDVPGGRVAQDLAGGPPFLIPSELTASFADALNE